MAKNKSATGVKSLPNGVQYKIIEAGKGAKPTQASTVQLEVAGPFPWGQRPQQGHQAQQIPGIKVSAIDIKGMRGSPNKYASRFKAEITLPADAYGADPRNILPPNAAVQFEVKLLSVK